MTGEGTVVRVEQSSSGAGFRPGSGLCVCVAAGGASEGDACGVADWSKRRES